MDDNSTHEIIMRTKDVTILKQSALEVIGNKS